MIARIARIATVVSMMAACGGAGRQPAAGAHAGAHHPGRGADGDGAGAAETDDRALAGDATWADLIGRARLLDDHRADRSDDGCLLGRAGAGYRLHADLAVAVRPLSTPEVDLDARFEGSAALGIVSRWPLVLPSSGAAPDVLVADFTTTSIPAPGTQHLVIAMTDHGAVVRLLDGDARRADDETLGAVIEAVRRSTPHDLVVHVVAEARVPLARVARLLSRVASIDGTQVTLAAVLPPDAHPPVPAAPASVPETTGLCPDGLPDDGTSPDARDAPSIVHAMQPLRGAAQRCFEDAIAQGTTSARLVLAMRIDQAGSVVEACAAEETDGSLALRTCVLSAARAIAFGPVDQPGTTVIELPLVMRPGDEGAQRAWCD